MRAMAPGPQGQGSALLARACSSVACRVSTPSKAATRRGRAISATSRHAMSAQRTSASQNSGKASAAGGGAVLVAVVALFSLGSVTACARIQLGLGLGLGLGLRLGLGLGLYA